MLYNYIIALIILAAGYQISEAISENKVLTFGERVVNVLEKKCAHNADQIEFNDIQKELEHVKTDCFNLHIGPEEVSDEKLTSLCHEQSEKFLQCLTTFVEKVDPCLDPQEKELKQFVLDIFNASTKYFCDEIKILNTNQLLKTNTAKCITTLKENPEINPHRVCFENSTIIGDYPKGDIITKYELCSEVMQASFCYYDLLKEHCPESGEVAIIQKGLISTSIEKCVPILFRGTKVVNEDATLPTPSSK